MNKYLILVLLILIVAPAKAQELNCVVTVNSRQIEGSEKTTFQAMERSIREFVNNRRWTNDVFKTTERIECSILINLTEQLSQGEFKGSIQITASRPIYGTSYNTTLFNHNDGDFQFRFQQFDVLDFSQTAHLSNLTSVLAYYIYIIIGLDYDSFSLKGGTPYFQKALAIVNNAQGAQELGWKAFESSTNRYWLVENMLDTRFSPLRVCMYKYHREGFDILSEKTDEGRGKVTEALQELAKVHQAVPNSFNLRVFFNAKSEEIIKLYSTKAFPEEKTRIVNLLNQIDPANTNRYAKIKNAG